MKNCLKQRLTPINQLSFQVRGFSPNTSNDTIKYYFESRRSDGGNVESFTIDNDRTFVHVTFEINGGTVFY